MRNFPWFKGFGKPKTLGVLGEEWALKEYRKLGYKLVKKNYFNKKGIRLGEIDFIVRKADQLVFVEVKARTVEEGRFGRGAEAVDKFKQVKILRSVKQFLGSHLDLQNLAPRIDVCEVVVEDFDKARYRVIMYEGAVEDWN